MSSHTTKHHFWISLQFLFYIWNSQITWYSMDKIGTKFHNTASEIIILYFRNADKESHWITDLLDWCMARLPTLYHCCFKQFVIIHLDLVANLATSNSLLANWWPSQWTWRCWVFKCKHNQPSWHRMPLYGIDSTWESFYFYMYLNDSQYDNTLFSFTLFSCLK